MSDDKFVDLFKPFGCPGVKACTKPRKSLAYSNELFPCADCQAPPHIYAPDGTKVYRSYDDYCD